MDNPQAFPGGSPSKYDGAVQGGMTLRDWFAGQALGGLLKVSKPDSDESIYAGFAELAASDAYLFADAMLAERAKGVDQWERARVKG